MRITNRRIASIAGVSPSTVSKVFSGSNEISPQTAKHVMAVARENGWTPPNYSKTTALSDTNSVAILIPELISYYYAHIATVMVEKLRRHNIEPQVHISGLDREGMVKTVDSVLSGGNVSGIILVDAHVYPKDSPVPIVGFASVHEEDVYYPYDIVFAQSDFGIGEILRYLYSIGHRDIMFVSENNTKYKRRMFISQMERQGCSADDIRTYVSSERFENAGIDAAKHILERKERLPTAVVCAYDEIAHGFIRKMQSNGVSVPGDISVVGINNIPSSANAEVPLTTVQTNHDGQADAAVDLLVKRMTNPDIHGKMKVEMQCELVVRASSAPPKGNL